jgi:hypothetical protein
VTWRVWRYQRGNQNLYIKEGRTTQWPKEKVQNGKQRSQELLSLPEHLSSPRFSVGSCYSIFSFMCMFCGSLFAVLYFFFWPLCCPSFFDVQILITPLVSSNSSRHFLNSIFSSFFFGQVKRMYYPVNFVVGHSFQKINTISLKPCMKTFTIFGFLFWWGNLIMVWHLKIYWTILFENNLKWRIKAQFKDIMCTDKIVSTSLLSGRWIWSSSWC